MNAIDPTHIRLGYYESANEPRIVLFGPLSVDLVPLEKCFRQLSASPGHIEFHALPFVFVSGDIRLQMRSIGDGMAKRKDKPLRGLYRTDERSASFQWTRTREEWDYLAELLIGLIQAKQPGHQYMTRYPEEDAVVVVSKGEYDDFVLTR